MFNLKKITPTTETWKIEGQEIPAHCFHVYLDSDTCRFAVIGCGGQAGLFNFASTSFYSTEDRPQRWVAQGLAETEQEFDFWIYVGDPWYPHGPIRNPQRDPKIHTKNLKEFKTVILDPYSELHRPCFVVGGNHIPYCSNQRKKEDASFEAGTANFDTFIQLIQDKPCHHF